MTNYNLHLGDNLATLKTYPDNHFDSIVTDHFTGCELDPKYVEISKTRIEAWNDSGLPDDLFGEIDD